MDKQELIHFAQQHTPPWHDQLTETFAHTRDGKPVIVLGSGPSAAGYKRAPGDFVIACNGAIEICPDADVWLCAESTVPDAPWFAGHEAFAGVVTWAADLVMCGGAETVQAAYSDAFLARVVWFIRRELITDFHIREAPYGLVHVEGDPASCNGGSVTLNAYHLAGIMGASEVHTYGCEFCYTGGKQYASGYAPDDAPIDYATAELTVQTNPLLVAHAGAFRAVATAWGHELPLVDHSAGLLGPDFAGHKKKKREVHDTLPAIEPVAPDA